MRCPPALRAIGALVVLLLLLGGLPSLLAVAVGNPVAGLPDLAAGDVTDAALIDVLAAVAWLAWAQFAVATAVEGMSALRRTPIPRRIPLLLPGQQQFARVLVTALLLTPAVASALLPTTPYARAASTSPGTHSTRAGVTSTATGASPGGHRPPATLAAGPGKQPAARHPKPREAVTPIAHDRTDLTAATGTTLYVVPAGDGAGTYWDLAATWLGSGERWPEIWRLNEGRQQADGAVMSSPRLLRPGWTVLLPEPHHPNGAPSGPATARTPIAAAAEVTVHPGDTLSQITADHSQGDWHRTWDANAGRREPDGARFTNPDLIRPGWQLTVPAPAAASARADLAPSPTRPVPESKVGQPPLPATSKGPGPVVVPTPTEPRPDPHNAWAPRSTGPPEQSAPDHGSDSSAASSAPGADRTALDAPRPSATSGTLPMVAFAGGGGALLAGLILTALRRHRRRQFRDRGLGRTITATPPDLAPVEKALLARGTAGSADMTWLNEALRSLVHTLAAAPDSRLPDVVAVRMTHDLLELVLSTSHRDPPKPWLVNESGLRWSVRRSDTLPFDPADAVFHYAPYPTLVTIGSTAAGEHWLLDLEQIGALTLTGDPERCTDLSRFLAAELAHNSWSEQLHVTLAGFGQELRGLNPSRIKQADDRADIDAAIAALHGCLRENQQVAEQTGVDVLTGRLRNIHGDVWAPQVLLIAPHTDINDGLVVAGDVDPDPDLEEDGLPTLLEVLRAEPARTAVALVLISGDLDENATDTHLDNTNVEDEQVIGADWQLHLDADGTLTIPALGVQVQAQQLPASEAADLAALLALAADGADRPVPVARGDQPWDAYADAAGAPRADLTSRGSTGVGSRVDTVVDLTAATPVVTGPAMGVPVTGSVLPLTGSVYLQRAATTAADLDALAPKVSAQVRGAVLGADPDLDADLADWRDTASQRPKLRLLGPISLTAGGHAPDKRPAFYTELVTYLASRPHGVTLEQFACDLWPDDPGIAGKTTPRQAASVARTWLGVNPRTGQHYLPKAADGIASVGVYRVQDLLIDAELFRRLRLRGVAAGTSGTSGLADLQAALELVTGAPLDQRRPDGYRWLVDLPLDHEYTGMIVDVAHLVATHHLAGCAPELAQAAANVALLAGAQDDVALLDLVVACDATGNHGEADRYVKRILANHDAEVEEDLPARTYEVLRRRQWLPGHAVPAQVR